MKGLTSRQKLVYSYRRYLLQYYSTGPGSKLAKSQRFYDIVNQTDPEELFKHLSDESLIQKITQDAVSKKPPDDAIFNRQRTTLGGQLHHESELERNRQSIPPEWDDIELYEYHQELKDIKERTGSAPENLPELREVDHDPKGADRTPESVARSAHPLGTKSAAGPLEYDPNNVLSPKARAGEVYLMNLPDKERIRAIEMDPERPSFKAYEEAQRINQEMGLPPQERRTARPGRTGSVLTSQANYEKFATPELVEVTGIPTKKISLSGYTSEAVKEAASMLVGKTAAGRAARLAGVATLPGALTLPASAKAFDEAKQAREQDPSLRNRALEIATGMQVAGDTLDVGGTALTATGAGAPVGVPMAAVGGAVSNVGAVAEQVITAPEAYQRSVSRVAERTGKTEEEVRADPLGYGSLFNTIKDKLGQISLSGYKSLTN